MTQTDSHMRAAVLHSLLRSRLDGVISQQSFIGQLKWRMALENDATVRYFIDSIRDDSDLDPHLVDEVSRTYTDNVSSWNFPEEQGLSDDLTGAIECTFPDLIRSLHNADVALRIVNAKLVGVNVRLNLRGTYSATERALRMVRENLAQLEYIGELIATRAPIRGEFPEQPGEEDRSWSSPDGVPLSPKQIIWLAKLARSEPEISLDYATGISAHSTPPQLVTARYERQEENRRFEEKHARALARSCPYCHRGPGEACRSKSGQDTSTHKGRFGD